MVKVPSRSGPKRVLYFRDDRGRFVKESERYVKATSVQRVFRGSLHTIWEARKGQPHLRPETLATLVPRDIFESVAPAFSPPTGVITPSKAVKKYTAWDLANKASNVRGLKGHLLKATMHIMDGGSLRKIEFFTAIKKSWDKRAFAYRMFRAMNRAIGNIGGYLYDRIGSKILPDRKGKQVHLMGIELAKEL